MRHREVSVDDGDPIRRYLVALFAAAPSGSLIELRWRSGNGMDHAFLSVDALDDFADGVEWLAAGTDVYVGLLPRRRPGGGRDDLVNAGSVLWADCDAPASVAALRRFSPAPSMVVRSGTANNVHAYWLLSELASIDAIERANHQLADELESDPACAEPARILRPPSLNHKHDPPAPVRLERCDADTRHELADVVAGLPVSTYWPRRSSPARDRVTDDPLLAIPPALYVERLTSLRVPRSHKLPCPFHPDDTPSLHVYADPAHGWYCYGCRRGGSVYDFAALLWQCETRGSGFLYLRARLLAELGCELAADFVAPPQVRAV